MPGHNNSKHFWPKRDEILRLAHKLDSIAIAGGRGWQAHTRNSLKLYPDFGNSLVPVWITSGVGTTQWGDIYGNGPAATPTETGATLHVIGAQSNEQLAGGWNWAVWRKGRKVGATLVPEWEVTTDLRSMAAAWDGYPNFLNNKVSRCATSPHYSATLDLPVTVDLPTIAGDVKLRFFIDTTAIDGYSATAIRQYPYVDSTGWHLKSAATCGGA